MLEMTDIASVIAGLMSAVLSLLVEIPVIKQRFDRLNSGLKKIVMLALATLIGIGVYNLACAGYLSYIIPGIGITCDDVGIARMIRALIPIGASILSNQATFMITPKKKDFEKAPDAFSFWDNKEDAIYDKR